MSRLRLAVCCVGVICVVSACSSVRTETGPAVSKDKKLIAWICDQVDAAEMRRRAAEMQQIPFDGVVITVRPDASSETVGRYSGWFGGRRHSRDEFKQAIADLKEAGFRGLTDSFIDFETTVRHDPAPEEANLDWFDPNWSVVADNSAVAAYVAKEGGLKGLFLDLEGYGGGLGLWRFPFDYDAYVMLAKEAGKTPRTFDECVAQIRRRGREFMQAVTAVYPDITIVVIGDTGWASGPLVPAFVKGMLEVRGAATIVDGIEQGYPLMTHGEFSQIRQSAQGRQTSKLYEGMEYGFGVWWDKPGPTGWHTDPKDFNKNHRSPERLEHALYNAFTVSDRYVWLYGGCTMAHYPSAWWHSSFPRAAHYVKPMQQAYLDAFKNCRKPHDLAWIPVGEVVRVSFDGVVLVIGDKITQGAQNLLTNGDFSDWPGAADEAPGGWVLLKAGLQSGKSARIRRDDASARVGQYSPELGMGDAGDTGHISLDQAVSAELVSGRTVTFGAWIRTSHEPVGTLEIVDVYQGNTSTVSPPDARGWRFHTLTGAIAQERTGTVVFRLRAFIPYLPQ